MGDAETKGITFQPDIHPKVRSLRPSKPARVAGEAYFCKFIPERGYEAEACDYQQELFKMSGVPFHQADLNRSIPLPDNSYDCIVSIGVLEDLENHVQFIRVVMWVLKKGQEGDPDDAERTEPAVAMALCPLRLCRLRIASARPDPRRLLHAAHQVLFRYRAMALGLRGKLLRSKYRAYHDLYRRHIQWVLHAANLTGRITIAMGGRWRIGPEYGRG